MKITKMILAASSLVLASAAFAADEPPTFEKADANGDGFVDSGEYAKTKMEQDFAEFDANKDGKLNKAEFEELANSECA